MILCKDVQVSTMLGRMAKTAKLAGIKDADPGLMGLRSGTFKSASVKPDNGGYDIECLATSDNVDCEREVVVPDGLDWGPLNTYKAIYGEHTYGTRNAVATLRWVTRSTSPNGFRMRVRMLPDWYSDDIPRYKMLAERGALGMSIGFYAVDRSAPTPEEKRRYPGAESIVRKASVFECSLTPCPANMSCSGAAVYADDSKSAVLHELVAKGLLPDAYAPKHRRLLLLT